MIYTKIPQEAMGHTDVPMNVVQTQINKHLVLEVRDEAIKKWALMSAVVCSLCYAAPLVVDNRKLRPILINTFHIKKQQATVKVVNKERQGWVILAQAGETPDVMLAAGCSICT